MIGVVPVVFPADFLVTVFDVPGHLASLQLAAELRAAYDDAQGVTAYYFGSIEEWCEGLSAQVFAEEERLRPDFVVIGEPTNLRVYRGHKGRVEFRVTANGRSAHGASHWLGDNALYKMQEVIRAIPQLDARLPEDAFLGRGSIVATHIEVRAGSLNVVPDRCEIEIDRRLAAAGGHRAIRDAMGAGNVTVLTYESPRAERLAPAIFNVNNVAR